MAGLNWFYRALTFSLSEIMRLRMIFRGVAKTLNLLFIFIQVSNSNPQSTFLLQLVV